MFGLIVGAISSVLGVVAKLVPAVLKIVGTELGTIAKALEAFFTVPGILKPGEDVEELGDKALQAEEDELQPIKPENFDGYEKYLEKVEEYETDPEKSALRTRDEKLHKGIEVLMGAGIEKFGEGMTEFFPIILRDPAFYGTTGRLEGLARAFQGDKELIGDVAGYLSGKSTDSLKNDRAFDALVAVEKNITPGASEGEIIDVVEGMRMKK